MQTDLRKCSVSNVHKQKAKVKCTQTILFNLSHSLPVMRVSPQKLNATYFSTHLPSEKAAYPCNLANVRFSAVFQPSFGRETIEKLPGPASLPSPIHCSTPLFLNSPISEDAPKEPCHCYLSTLKRRRTHKHGHVWVQMSQLAHVHVRKKGFLYSVQCYNCKSSQKCRSKHCLSQTLLISDSHNSLHTTGSGTRALCTENLHHMSASKRRCNGGVLVAIGMNSSPPG